MGMGSDGVDFFRFMTSLKVHSYVLGCQEIILNESAVTTAGVFEPTPGDLVFWSRTRLNQTGHYLLVALKTLQGSQQDWHGQKPGLFRNDLARTRI